MQIYADNNKVDVLELAVASVCLLVTALIAWFPPALTAAFTKNIRRSTIEIDDSAHQLRVTTRYFGVFARVVFDSPVQECVACGVIVRPYGTKGRLYCESSGGSKFDYAVNLDSQEAISLLADQISTATGVPRMDIAL